MKRITMMAVLLLSFVSHAWAGGSSAWHNSYSPQQHKALVRKHLIGHQVTFVTGSLKDNLARVAKRFGWKKIVWLPNSDYQWVGRVSIHEKTVYALFSRVLHNYPLQAVFYQGNRVLVIKPRNI